MSETLQNLLSSQVMGLKGSMGTLLELVESWILSLGGEDERRQRVEHIRDLALAADSGLRPELRGRLLEEIEKLLGPSGTTEMASFSFRKNLQRLFRTQTERLNLQLDQLLGQIKKLTDALEQGDPATGIILAQEDERKRISREIHDGPAQSLASLTMRIDYCFEIIQDGPALKTELGELKDSIIRSLKDIRRFIFDLRPMALDDLGLIPTLEQYVAGFKGRTGTAVSMHVEGPRRSLPPEKELAVFRVVQEAMNNAHRHAQARAINIFLSFDDGKHTLTGTIKDDGVGFDLPALRKGYRSLKKLGLVSMEERIRLAGGHFDLASAMGEGTVVSFVVPL